MNRRDSLKTIFPATLAGGTLATLLSQDAGFDQYGGWKGKKFKATGYFRVEKDQRWWLVTPEGNAFLSFGINHFYPDLFRQPFNRDAWQKNLNIQNLDDQSKFNPAARNWLLQTCRDFGINTVGVHNALQIANKPSPGLPYMKPIRFVDIPHWRSDVPDEKFVDVFAPEFAAHCNQLAEKHAAPLKDDPFLIGYTMTDCPLFTEEDCRERPDVIGGARRKSRIGWPRKLRNLGANSPGKAAYVRTMKRIYRDRIEDFNQTYQTEFTTFDELANAVNWRPDTELSNANETRDNVEFIQVVVYQYYETTKNAIQRHDPNHMFIGDKLNANTDSLDTVIRTTTKFTDIILYQMYARYEVQQPGLDRWAKLIDQPVINGDSSFTMVTETMPRPYGPVADSLEQRTEWTEEFFRKAFARPEFIGWHYCGLIDASNLILRKRDRQHSGLLDAYGNPQGDLMATIKSCADEMYQIALKQK